MWEIKGQEERKQWERKKKVLSIEGKEELVSARYWKFTERTAEEG